MISMLRGGRLISSTVNRKTNTTVEKFAKSLNGGSGAKGLLTVIDYGPKTSMRNMGVSEVLLQKAPGKKGLVTFVQELGDNIQSVTFQKGAPEIRQFVDMLKDYVGKCSKPDFKTIKAFLKL